MEEQQSLAGETKPAGTAPNAASDKAALARSEAEKKRLRQALELQRERVLSERTSNPHRRSALENALADIEEKLAELGWTIHL
ncbi:hypothetical protein SAMN05421771_4215 [Granulicella pectinivorans]|uniref:Uncharacterized protein n=1 Tax=Granulicella pectinivorans TaxID=474950 RepID=A0A1I6N0J3_9BACT|nr:hypothetical protein SAMN05421771_4215 [Granulicella pectinivorans]